MSQHWHMVREDYLMQQQQQLTSRERVLTCRYRVSHRADRISPQKETEPNIAPNAVTLVC